MKKIIIINILLTIGYIAYSQNSKFYVTSRVNTNFAWKILNSTYPNPTETSHSFDLYLGRKVKKLRSELGFEIKYNTNQSDVYSFNSNNYILSPTVKLGFTDSLALGSMYYIGPYYSQVFGKGKISNNGFDAFDETRGNYLGLLLAINKNIYEKIGFQINLYIQNENYKNYRGLINGIPIKQENISLFPQILLTYNL